MELKSPSRRGHAFRSSSPWISAEFNSPRKIGLSDEGPPSLDDDVLGADRIWHHRYNRSLACFANPVSCITFSNDGLWVTAGTGAGDLKVWDTTTWASTATLKVSRREEPSALLVSPNQTWLVCVQASALHVFRCGPPWQLEQVILAMVCPGNQEASDWCCAAFGPGVEVDHALGRTGTNNHLAVLSTSHLCVLDYSGGWDADEIPRRTHSILRYARPTGIGFTNCGKWIACAYDNGSLQLWNASSLTLDIKCMAHTGAVLCMAVSPASASYDCRIATVGQDKFIRLWSSSSWSLEVEKNIKSRIEDVSIGGCFFSPNGEWLVTVAEVLCLWRVCLSSKGSMWLRLHHRLEAVASVEGICTAAFSSLKDALVIGTRDGVLGAWARHTGLPPDFPYEEDQVVEPLPPMPVAWSAERNEQLPRPMRRVMALAVPLASACNSPIKTGPEGWRTKWQLTSTIALPTPLPSSNSLSLASPIAMNSGSHSDDLHEMSRIRKERRNSSSSTLSHSTSAPEIRRWSSRSFQFEAVVNCQAVGHQVIGRSLSKPSLQPRHSHPDVGKSPGSA